MAEPDGDFVTPPQLTPEVPTIGQANTSVGDKGEVAGDANCTDDVGANGSNNRRKSSSPKKLTSDPDEIDEAAAADDIDNRPCSSRTNSLRPILPRLSSNVNGNSIDLVNTKFTQPSAPTQVVLVECESFYDKPSKTKGRTLGKEELIEIPRIYDTKLVVKDDDDKDILLRAKISTYDQMKRWIAEYSAPSGTGWTVIKTTGVYSKTHALFYCRYYTRKGKDATCKFNHDCPAKITFTSVGRTCDIHMHLNHTDHPEGGTTFGLRKGVPQEVINRFHSYFAHGNGPTGAREEHEQYLRTLPKFSENMLHDGCMMPTANKVREIYELWIQTHCNGIKPKRKMAQKHIEARNKRWAEGRP